MDDHRITLTELQLREAFNALLERQHRLARELRFPDDIKADELHELQESLQGTQGALDVLQAAATGSVA
jgi:hypothetical protein